MPTKATNPSTTPVGHDRDANQLVPLSLRFAITPPELRLGRTYRGYQPQRRPWSIPLDVKPGIEVRFPAGQIPRHSALVFAGTLGCEDALLTWEARHELL